MSNSKYINTQYREHLAFWKNCLEQCLGSYRLGSLSHSDSAPEILPYTFKIETAQVVRGLVKNNEDGIFVVLLSSLQILLAQMSRENKVIVDAPMKKGLQDDVLSLFFVRELNPSQSIKEVLVGNQQYYQNALKYQQLPVGVIDEHWKTHTLSNVQLLYRKIHTSSRRDLHPISFEVSDDGEGLTLELHYNTGLFSGEFALSLLQNWENVLLAMKNPNKLLQEITIPAIPGELALYPGGIDFGTSVDSHYITLNEIEAALLAHPKIESCLIAVQKNYENKNELLAYWTGDATVDSESFQVFLRESLPEYMIPAFFERLTEIPLDAQGKINRKVLQKLPGAANEAALSETEQKLAVIWQEVLRIGKVEANDNFFELGGHSLFAMQIISRIFKEFKVDLSINSIFTAPTLSALSGLIDAENTSEFKPIAKVAEADSYPLSGAQKRIWVLSQIEGASKAYNVPYAFAIAGDFDSEAFEKALALVIQRHESLRTVFTLIDDEPRQRILPYSPEMFGLKKLNYPGEKSPQAIQELLAAQNTQIFDLETGPLIEAKLLGFKNEEYVFLLNMHHIIMDGWGMQVFVAELLQFYKDYSSKQEPNAPALSIQYKDFSAWQNESFEKEEFKQMEQYWLDQFSTKSGDLPILNLPTDYPRPKTQNFNGAVYLSDFDEELSQKLKSFSQQREGTLYTSLLAGLTVLLHKYTAQEDFIIGTPIACRNHADLENQIGLYMNILALRSRFTAKNSFDEILQQVISNSFLAFEHQSYPFDVLVNKLQPTRDLSRSPLFDVCLILQNIELQSAGTNTPDSVIQFIRPDHTVSKYDLTFIFEESGNKLHLMVEYNTDLFTESTVARMSEHFKLLLKALLSESSAPIEELVYLPENELQQILTGFNKTDYPVPYHTILDEFEKQVRLHPEKIALIGENEQLTFLELDRRSNQLANYLLSKSLEKEELVGIYLDKSTEMVIALYATLKAGGAYLPLDPKFPADRITNMVEDSKTRLVISDGKLADQMTLKKAVYVLVDRDRQAIESTPEELLAPQITPKNLAYVIYTSGSTGNPKGVAIEHRQVVNFFYGMDQHIPLEKDNNSLLQVTSISFDISVLELFWTLSRGVKVVLYTNEMVLGQNEPSLRPIDFSLFYFASGEDEKNKYKLLLEGAKYADNNGFSAVWTPERHFHDFGGIFPNPSITGAAIATITQNIQIRSGSCVLPLHNPIRVAEEWAVVDNLSNGRVGLSFASGWVLNDFHALSPGNHGKRHKMLYEGIETVQKLWRGESIDLLQNGDANNTVRIYPKPIQAELPFWVTASGNPETFQKAGELGANMLTHLLGQTVEELAEKIKIYRQARAAAGFEGKGHVSLMIHAYVGTDFDEIIAECRKPFCDYLRSAAGLIRNFAQGLGKDIDDENFSESDMDSLLDYAFNRYYNTAALLGTPETCLDLMKKLSLAEVDEVACLIDFGVDSEHVLENLEHLNTLKKSYAKLRDQSQLQSISDTIRKQEISHLQCTPSFMKILLAENDYTDGLPSLKTVMLGGEALAADLLKQIHHKLHAEVHNMYGPTETTIWSASKKLTRRDELISIGKPILNTQIYILDAALKAVPIGVTGELYISGNGLARGYLNRSELTAERFVNNPFAEGLMYKTGDLAYWQQDGSVVFVGRNDEQVKIRGHRIELGEIESRLKAIDGIREAVVTVQGEEAQLMAYIVSTSDLTAASIQQHLQQHLPEYMIPNQLLRIEKLPLTPNGKIDKKALAFATGSQLESGSEYEAPVSENEILLVEVWEQLLNREKISVLDSFFRIGGDSIRAIQVASKLNQQGFKLEVRDIFNHPTIKELAPKLRLSVRKVNQEPISGSFSLTPIQHWFYEMYPYGEKHYNHSVMLQFKEKVSKEHIESCVQALYKHFDTLRSNFSFNDEGIPEAFISADLTYHLDYKDYSQEENPLTILQTYAQEVQTSMVLEQGPLFKTVLFHLEDADRLLISIHHLIVDGISWRLIFEALNVAYQAASQGQGIVLPLKTDSFQTWSADLIAYGKSEFLRKQKGYWKQIVDGKLTALPLDYPQSDSRVKDENVKSFNLDRETTADLLGKAHEAYHTEINDLLLAGLGIALKKWTRADEQLIFLEGHGREDIQSDSSFENTIGWFTSLFPVRIQHYSADLEKQISRVKENLRSIPSKGIGYGVLRYLTTELGKVEIKPEIIFNYLGQFDGDVKNELSIFKLANESVGKTFNPESIRPFKLIINGLVQNAKLEITITYSTKDYKDESIEEFIQLYQTAMEEIVAHCITKDSTQTLSDYAYTDMKVSDLGIEDLNELFD